LQHIYLTVSSKSYSAKEGAINDTQHFCMS